MGHLTATVVLLAAGQAGEEVVVVGWQAWPWARHCCHQRVIVVFVLAGAMAEQMPLEPTLVDFVEAKYPGYRSSRGRSWAPMMS